VDKESERLGDSLQYAHTIQDSYEKAKRLNNIASQFVRIGQLEKASEIRAQALQVVQGIADDYSKVHALILIANNITDETERLTILAQALQFTQNIPDEDDSKVEEIGALIEIARSMPVGQTDRVFEILTQTLAIAHTIANTAYKAEALASVAMGAISISKLTEQEIWSQILQVAQTIDDANYRNKALRCITYSMASSGQVNQAFDILNENLVQLPSDNCNASEYFPLMGEEAISKWAVYGNVQEAYRFTYLPSFHPPMVIRIWTIQSKIPSFHALAKLGVTQSHTVNIKASDRRRSVNILTDEEWEEIHAASTRKRNSVQREESWTFAAEDWERLLTAIYQSKFWLSVAWDFACDSVLRLDGSEWKFEGWQSGQYKYLDAWSPDSGPAYTLGQYFFRLLPRSWGLYNVY
jgi:tetratricopeptide (TPR) repeat protein